MVAGCLEGGCHFQEGNLRARKRTERAQEYLREIGLEPERLAMYNLSSAEGTRFAEIVNEMSATLHRLGPSPLRMDPTEMNAWVEKTASTAQAAISKETRHDCCG
jgi:coenzyme F420-reducing hydrogenase delta subunit